MGSFISNEWASAHAVMRVSRRRKWQLDGDNCSDKSLQQRVMQVLRKSCLFIGIAALTACSATKPIPQPAQVRFVVDAPFCGLSIPTMLLIDSVVVDTDTFRVHMQPDHLESKTFSVTPGAHLLGAKTFGGLAYTWRDTVVNVAAGAKVVDTLPFYCF
ncbi:MAG: hypothetical protein ABI852_09450 [Gemmatimonadaceae bacterium]